MRITNSQIYNQGLSTSMRAQNELLRLQQIFATGKKVTNPSDDPIASSQINLLSEQISLGERLERNRQGAEGQLAFEETTLGHAVETLQNLRSLQVRAGNSSYTETERRALAVEAEQLLQQLQAIANTQDSEKHYIFSGSLSNTETITQNASGQYVFNGDQTQRFQSVSTGLSLALNDSGADLFMRNRSGNGDFTVAESPVPNTGTASATSGSIIDTASYVVDDYTIQFALNTQNELVVLVSGAGSGNLIPPTGLPDDAPLYQAGSAIAFNGISLTVDGAPKAGDSFLVRPASTVSIFDTLTNMIDNLRQPFNTGTDQARAVTRNNQILEEIDSAMQTILEYQATAGAKLNQLDLAEIQNTSLINISTDTKSLLEDADLFETYSKLQLQEMYLQVAQQSFVRIQGLSLLNYL